LKKQNLSKITLIISLIIIALIFIVPVAQATISEDDATGNTITTFNEAPNHTDQQDALKGSVEKSDGNAPSSSPELCIALNDKLKWFFAFETPDFIEDLYDERDDFNYRAFVGFHIAL
jgi:hypothetical protein